LKDNRILPKGWTKQGPDVKMPQHFLEATWPVGQALNDPAYLSGSGTSRLRYEIPVPAGHDPGTLQVQATLYYQSIPPDYLEQRFRIGGNGPATRRLYYLTSRLALDGTPLAGWKLKIASASAGPLE
jgi:hypothetical protein